MVQNNAYVTQDPSTRGDRLIVFHVRRPSFLGQKVVKRMLFKEEDASMTSCPICYSSSGERQTSDVQ